VAQASDAICPVSFHWGAPLELETKFGEELNGAINVFHHDADVVHTLDRHDVSLASNVLGMPRRAGCVAARRRRRTTTRCQPSREIHPQNSLTAVATHELINRRVPSGLIVRAQGIPICLT